MRLPYFFTTLCSPFFLLAFYFALLVYLLRPRLFTLWPSVFRAFVNFLFVFYYLLSSFLRQKQA